MKRTWTIIGVNDVRSSLKWYESLLGQPEHEMDSSERAFYRASRSVIEQAYTLANQLA